MSTKDLPCKIGQLAYGLRNYKGQYHVQRGFISEMYYRKDMVLQIVIKHVCRGELEKNIFLTQESANEALKRLKKEV